MEQEMISIPRVQFEELQMKANIDLEFLQELMMSFKDIKEGRIRRVK